MQSNVFLTRFVGYNLVKLVKVDSTNNYLKELLANTKPLQPGTVIMADDQFAGRGQSNNKWHSQAGKNLTFSIYLQPRFLAVQQQFKINQAITLGITDALITLLGNGCKIKWPNDIYFNDDKIGGVLIENTIRGNTIIDSIIGIGINVNQKHYTTDLVNVNSLVNLLGVEFDLNHLLGDILLAVENRYFELEKKGINILDTNYIERLYKAKQKCKFKKGSNVFEAIILGVSQTGLLILETKEERLLFNLKEIELVN